jgi:hypothetical protein
VGSSQSRQPAPYFGPLAIAPGKALLDLGSAPVHLRLFFLDAPPGLTGLGGFALGVAELARVRSELLRDQPAAQLSRFAFQAGVDVRRLGLAFEGPQPAASLALDVKRPVEILLRALELELRPPAALAVLPEPGGLLDQKAPVARLRVDYLLHPPLTDHRVHLAAEVRVGKHLDHIDEPAARPVQPVLALPASLHPPPDRDL